MKRAMSTIQNSQGGKAWFTFMVMAIILALGLRLTQALVNIERTDTAYAIEAMENKLEAARELVGKLEVERNNLRSSSELMRLADTFELGPAGPGRIRRVEEPGT